MVEIFKGNRDACATPGCAAPRRAASLPLTCEHLSRDPSRKRDPLVDRDGTTIDAAEIYGRGRSLPVFGRASDPTLDKDKRPPLPGGKFHFKESLDPGILAREQPLATSFLTFHGSAL